MTETNFKHTEIGLIPHDWEVKNIKDCFDFKQGVQCAVNLQSLQQTDGTVRFIRIVDLTQPDELPRYIADPGVSHHVKKDDLFMVRYGSPGLVGYGYEGVIANNLFRLLPKIDICSKLYKYILTDLHDEIVALSSSSTMPAVNFTALSMLQLPLPPTIAEQERIAGALSSIDTLIGALTEQIEKKRHIKQGAMQQLLTGKKRLAGFTGAWKEVRLGDNCAITTGHKDVNIAVPNGQYNFYTCSRDVYKANTYSFDTEAILIAGNGDVGNLHYHKGKFEVYQRTYVLYDFKADVQYILHNLAWNLITHLKQGVVGSTIPYIVIGQLLDYPLVLPPTIAEQSAIAAVLSGMDTEIAALEQKRDKYIAIKSGMMQDLLTGKIRLV